MDELPALLGGEPVRPNGPPAWPTPDPDVESALQRAYADGSWGKYHGPNCQAFEQQLQTYHQVEHVLLCGSGTYAVELGLRALRVVPGDEVVLAAYDFPGNFLAIHAVGATPVLVDLDRAHWNLSPSTLREAISPATRGILVSHLHGGVVAMQAVRDFANAHGLWILEDACQCPGTLIQGARAGTIGDVGVLSFGGSKLLTAGRGGALLTRDAQLAQRARTLHMRGNLVSPLSELQAAVLVPQLAKLDDRNRQRLAQVEMLDRTLASMPGLRRFINTVDARPAFYKVGIQYDAAEFGLSRARFVAALRAEGIALDEGFAAAHVGRSPKRFRRGSSLTEAERAHHGCVILHHPVLLDGIDGVERALRKVLAHRERLRSP